MDQYKNLSKQFNKQKRSEIFNRIKARVNRLNPYPKIKYKYLTKANKAPDVSTITEHIAFVIDGQVVEIIHCQPKMAAILLSEPEIVKIPDGTFAKTGWSYEAGEFKQPTIDRQISVARDTEAIENNLPTFKEYQEQMRIESLPTFKEYIQKLKERV